MPPYYNEVPTDQNIFDTSSHSYKTGVGALQMAANPMAVNMTMNQFLNPYRESVINNAVGRLRDRKSEDLNMVRGQAAQAGAYGGARQGVVEADLMGEYGREEDELVSRLLQQGFDTRAGLSLEALRGQRAAGGQLVDASRTGYGLGASALEQQRAAGTEQRFLMQQILDQARQQFEGYTEQPYKGASLIASILSGSPLNAAQTKTSEGTQISSYNPGLFDYLSMGAGVAGGFK